MTDRMTAYRALIEQRPDWFKTAEDDGIKLVLDPEEMALAKAALAEKYPEYGEDATALGMIFDSPYYVVVRDAVRQPNGNYGGYIRVFNAPNRPEGVIILPTIGEDVVLTREFRHPVRSWRWQCPRGFGDPGESGETAARRELEEELGCDAVSVEFLGDVEPDNGSLGARPRFYRAEIESFEAAGLGDEAIAEAKRFSPTALRSLISEGNLCDGPTLSALALWWAARESASPAPA